jgi:EAL domain-containing protein (putative c-di-GMP-specific phosphodiesterase class I)
VFHAQNATELRMRLAPLQGSGMQGYLISRPVPRDEVTAALRARETSATR